MLRRCSSARSAVPEGSRIAELRERSEPAKRRGGGGRSEPRGGQAPRVRNSDRPPSRRRDARAADGMIEILGAREHNLRVDRLLLPKNALVVLTGPSGSGKSSLAFDTLYAEGQRRYV